MHSRSAPLGRPQRVIHARCSANLREPLWHFSTPDYWTGDGTRLFVAGQSRPGPKEWTLHPAGTGARERPPAGPRVHANSLRLVLSPGPGRPGSLSPSREGARRTSRCFIAGKAKVADCRTAGGASLDFRLRTRQHVVGGRLMGRDHHWRWTLRSCGALICALVAVAVAVPGSAAASAPRLYVAVGDSVGAGFGATSGQSYFDLYCAYLESAAAGALVDQCVNESVVGLTSQSVLDGGTIQKAINDIDGSADTPVVTVVLGGNDLLGSPGCQPITGAGCNFIGNMRTILNQIETALATHPGPHVIQWLEYYNPNHDNPFGNASADQSTAGLLLGNDFGLTDCSSADFSLIGLDDAINCIAKEKGTTPVDAYTPFQSGCKNNDCFSDSLHPNDKGYAVIFDAFRDTPGVPVPTTPPPDGSWPIIPHSPTISFLSETRTVFAPSSPHHKRGTVFSFRLDQPAKVTITIQRHAPGRRVGQSCRYPTPRLRHKPLCTRTIPIAALIKHGHTGLNEIPFRGLVRGRALKPGRYLAMFVAIDRAGASTTQTLHFSIVRS